jgi:hypothetical protein
LIYSEKSEQEANPIVEELKPRDAIVFTGILSVF